MPDDIEMVPDAESEGWVISKGRFSPVLFIVRFSRRLLARAGARPTANSRLRMIKYIDNASDIDAHAAGMEHKYKTIKRAGAVNVTIRLLWMVLPPMGHGCASGAERREELPTNYSNGT